MNWLRTFSEEPVIKKENLQVTHIERKHKQKLFYQLGICIQQFVRRGDVYLKKKHRKISKHAIHFGKFSLPVTQNYHYVWLPLGMIE